MFDSLLAGSLDETGVRLRPAGRGCGWSPDGLSATFRLRPQARFHNGDPVLAADVKHSYDTLMGPYTSPAYKTAAGRRGRAGRAGRAHGALPLQEANREMPLTVGGLPVFSRKWGMENGKAKPFDQVVMDIPIGSGPYKIGPVRSARTSPMCATRTTGRAT
jgi:microcin C transport system substrate-binding protein